MSQTEVRNTQVTSVEYLYAAPEQTQSYESITNSIHICLLYLFVVHTIRPNPGQNGPRGAVLTWIWSFIHSFTH